MALVNIINVSVLDNPAPFTHSLQFEITFECLQELQDDLEWKVVYVGNAEDSNCDQTLGEVMVGPVPTGINQFVLEAEAPNPSLIANQDLLGVTVLLVTCSYLDQDFVQIGYYVNNEYNEEFDPEMPPNPIIVDKITRNILANEPRVTRFAIDWTGNAQDMTREPNLGEEDEQLKALAENDDVIDMEEEDEEGEEDDGDDDEDNAGEEDLAENEAADEAELLEDGDEFKLTSAAELRSPGAALDSGAAAYPAQEFLGDVSMEVMNEDSNSMDVARIIRHQEQH